MSVTIQPGSTVGIHFKIYDEEGNLREECPSNAPLTFVHGEQSILPALEKLLLNKKVGDTCAVTLSPEDAYGAIQPQAIQTLKADVVPEEYRVVGNVITAKQETGDVLRFTIRENKGDTLCVDFNHPLAGLTLTFHLEVISIL
ncbi:MAG: FKBP-type peptidyl-prolyl cis-trans isomerase [Gammaproteobacteria bacterium]